MKTVLFATILLFAFTLAQKSSDDNQLLHRLIRAANGKKAECRYDKDAWEECDTSGLQRRALKLRVNPRLSQGNCEPIKYITRACKKACRYTKGEWTECVNGEKTRTDTLKNEHTVGCEATRSVTKKCKPVCRYDKSEWSPCQNNTKTKTLTVANGEPKECEASKIITKQCGQQSKRAKHGRQRGKKPSPATPS